MKTRNRRRSRAALFSMIDVFVCYSVVLLMILNQPVADQQKAVEAKKAEVAALEARVADLRATRDETESDIAFAQGQIEVEREHLAQKQRDYQDWDIVVSKFVGYSDLTREPDYHFYLRTSGIYSSASKTKWSRSGLKKWLTDVASQVPEDKTTDVVFYAENGANDMVISTRQMIDEINKDEARIIAHYVVLPPGVAAGPNQNIHKKQGGGK